MALHLFYAEAFKNNVKGEKQPRRGAAIFFVPVEAPENTASRNMRGGVPAAEVTPVTLFL